MQIEIWSDVVCPWCWIGRAHLAQALAQFEHADAVTVRWRSFQLDPGAPNRREGDYVGRLAGKYGVSRDQGQQMVDRMTEAGAAAGLEFHFERAVPGNTFDAHRLLHLAAERGCQDALKARLFEATFAEGGPVGDHEHLVAQAVAVGLAEPEVRSVLASNAYGEQVYADQAEAGALGATGVPFFVIDRRYAVPGAQPADVLLSVLRKAWDARSPQLVTVPSGPADGCEGDSCAV